MQKRKMDTISKKKEGKNWLGRGTNSLKKVIIPTVQIINDETMKFLSHARPEKIGYIPWCTGTIANVPWKESIFYEIAWDEDQLGDICEELDIYDHDIITNFKKAKR